MFRCPIELSLEDLDTLTESKALCNADGELDLLAFDRLVQNFGTGAATDIER